MISRSLFVKNKKLRMLEFNNNLFKSLSYIYITHSNGPRLKLTLGKYIMYKPTSDDTVDYSVIQDINELVKLKKVTKVLRKLLQSSGINPIYILVVQSTQRLIQQYLKDIGINSNKIVLAVLNSTTAKDETKWIETMIDDNGYNEIYFVDNDDKKVKAIKRILQNKDVRWKIQLIK